MKKLLETTVKCKAVSEEISDAVARAIGCTKETYYQVRFGMHTLVLAEPPLIGKKYKITVEETE